MPSGYHIQEMQGKYSDVTLKGIPLATLKRRQIQITVPILFKDIILRVCTQMFQSVKYMHKLNFCFQSFFFFAKIKRHPDVWLILFNAMEFKLSSSLQLHNLQLFILYFPLSLHSHKCKAPCCCFAVLFHLYSTLFTLFCCIFYILSTIVSK